MTQSRDTVVPGQGPSTEESQQVIPKVMPSQASWTACSSEPQG